MAETMGERLNKSRAFTRPAFAPISAAMSMMMTTKPTMTPTRMRGGPVVLAV